MQRILIHIKTNSFLNLATRSWSMQQTRWPVASINIVTGSYPKQVQYARVEAEIYIILFILLSSFYEQIIIETFIAMEYSQKHT